MPITLAKTEFTISGPSEPDRTVVVVAWLRACGTYAAIAGYPMGLPLTVETSSDVGSGDTWQAAMEDAFAQHEERERRRAEAHDLRERLEAARHFHKMTA